MTDLDKLIEAVEAGAFDADTERNIPRFNAFADAFESALGMKPSYSDGWGSYRGSLDAAHRLHEALLPGWAVENLGNAVIDGTGGWNVRLVAPDYLETFAHSTANAATPARAWLLAILRALKAKGDDA